MLNTIKEIIGFSVCGTDGKVGEIDDIYFDDHKWIVRYIIADTGNWLSSNKILLSPFSVTGIIKEKKEINFNLTKEKIKNRPAAETDKPVSRQHEADLAAYYGWPTYWVVDGMQPSPSFIPVMPIPPEDESDKNQEKHKYNPNLRSAAEVIGYNIKAIDDSIGHVESFLFDEDTWNIRYIVIATKNFLPGKKVILALNWIDSISWEDSTVIVTLKKEEIENSPEYNPDVPLNREYEEKLSKHYDRDIFW